jgi:hypothetical protein
MSGDLESRLRAAVQAEADAVDSAVETAEEPSLRAIRGKVRTVRRRRRALAAAAAIAVVAVAAATIPRLGGDPTDVDTVGQPDGDTAATTAPVPPAETTIAPPATTGTTAPSSTTAPPDAGTDEPETDILGDGYQPLWPFATRATAQQWQEAYRTGGQQPWHLDAEETALSFASGFLGFTEIDTVTSTDVGATDAEVGVGYVDPNSGETATAAVVHLMRYGSGDDAPWEVVGTRDTSLLLETPDYGTTASSPMQVGGYITGIDESLQVQVLQASSSEPLGRSTQPVPAGGENAPWQVGVQFRAPTDPAVTVVVWTGGHVQDVERFAITGLRRPGA